MGKCLEIAGYDSWLDSLVNEHYDIEWKPSCEDCTRDWCKDYEGCRREEIVSIFDYVEKGKNRDV